MLEVVDQAGPVFSPDLHVDLRDELELAIRRQLKIGVARKEHRDRTAEVRDGTAERADDVAQSADLGKGDRFRAQDRGAITLSHQAAANGTVEVTLAISRKLIWKNHL